MHPEDMMSECIAMHACGMRFRFAACSWQLAGVTETGVPDLASFNDQVDQVSEHLGPEVDQVDQVSGRLGQHAQRIFSCEVGVLQAGALRLGTRLCLPSSVPGM